MNLVYFLLIFCLIATAFGELAKFPFGSSLLAVSLIDVGIFLVMVFGLIWQIGIKKELRIPRAFFILVLFWIAACLSLFSSGVLDGGLYLVRFIMYSFVFYWSFLVVEQKKDRIKRFLYIVAFLGVLHSVFGFWQLVFFPDFAFLTEYGFDPHINRLTSTYLDPNFIGTFLNISLVVSLILFLKEKRKVWMLMNVLIVSAIIVTFSRSAYLMMITEIVVFSILRIRWLLAAMVCVVLLVYIASPRVKMRVNGIFNIDKTAKERIFSWKRGLDIFQENQIFGVGFNNLRYFYEQKNLFKSFSLDGGHSGAGVDSSFIFVLVTTGITGFLVYIIWWGEILRDLVRRAKLSNNHLSAGIISIILGLFVNSLFINSLFYTPIMYVVFLLLGLVYKNREEDVYGV